MPTTCHTLVNYLHHILICIILQVKDSVLQNDLIPQMHHYFIYHLWTFLRIFKFGYLASNIAINSSKLYCALKPCVTPFSSQHLTIYGLPITILENYVGTMRNITIGHTDKFWLSTMVLGHTTNITRTNQDTSPG